MGYLGNNAGRGRFKYICASCKTEQYIKRGRFAAATMPRCCACGSLSLDPVTSLAFDRIAAGNARRLFHREKWEKNNG